MQIKRNFLSSYLEEPWIIFDSSIFVKLGYFVILVSLCKFEKDKIQWVPFASWKTKLSGSVFQTYVYNHLNFRIHFPLEAMSLVELVYSSAYLIYERWCSPLDKISPLWLHVPATSPNCFRQWIASFPKVLHV